MAAGVYVRRAVEVYCDSGRVTGNTVVIWEAFGWAGYGSEVASVSEVWIRWALYFAGAWNLIGGATALAEPARHFAQMHKGALSLEDPLQAFFFRATWINVMGWGIGYVLAGRLPSARVPILAAGGMGKLAYFGACAALFMSGKGTAMLFAAGVLDVLFAVFFAYAIWPRQLQKTGAR